MFEKLKNLVETKGTQTRFNPQTGSFKFVLGEKQLLFIYPEKVTFNRGKVDISKEQAVELHLELLEKNEAKIKLAKAEAEAKRIQKRSDKLDSLLSAI